MNFEGLTVGNRSGVIYKGLEPISNDSQFAYRVQLLCPDENVIIYPASLKTKEPFAKYNLRRLHDNDKSVYIDSNEFYVMEDICHRLTDNYTRLYYPLSMRIKNKVSLTNIAPIHESHEIRIDCVTFHQHPYFKNIICSKKRFIDLNTFEFIEPTLEQRLPFILTEAMKIDEFGDYVYNKDTNTINNQEIDWTNLYAATPICEIRYYHPDYPEYFCDFYGKLFKIEKDPCEGKEIVSVVDLISPHCMVVKESEKYVTIPIDDFIFECFNNRRVEEGKYVELINKYPLSNPYLHCKWHYKECSHFRGMKTEEETKHIYRHPIHNQYGWDTKTDSAFSFYTRKHISSTSFITVERTIQNNEIPKGRFKYECLNSVDINDDFIVNGDKRIKFGTKEFSIDDEIFKITKLRYFYLSNHGRLFYTKYERIVNIENGYAILSRNNISRNIPLSSIVDIEKEITRQFLN